MRKEVAKGESEKKMAKEVRSVKGRGRHRGGAMREKVWRRKAHRKKVRNLIWLRVSAASLSLPADGGECKTESSVGIWRYQQCGEGLSCEGS